MFTPRALSIFKLSTKWGQSYACNLEPALDDSWMSIGQQACPVQILLWSGGRKKAAMRMRGINPSSNSSSTNSVVFKCSRVPTAQESGGYSVARLPKLLCRLRLSALKLHVQASPLRLKVRCESLLGRVIRSHTDGQEVTILKGIHNLRYAPWSVSNREPWGRLPGYKYSKTYRLICFRIIWTYMAKNKKYNISP